jgi:hypothetical protein
MRKFENQQTGNGVSLPLEFYPNRLGSLVPHGREDQTQGENKNYEGTDKGDQENEGFPPEE